MDFNYNPLIPFFLFFVLLYLYYNNVLYSINEDEIGMTGEVRMKRKSHRD